jgi:PKD repeat protein
MMKKLLAAITCILLLQVTNPVSAQVFILNEDFSGASVITPPSGWQNTTISGLSTDLWHFNNPGSRVVNLPVTSPFAVFDAENYSPGNGNEVALLTSPVFDASIGTYCLLYFDHFFSGGAGSVGKLEAFNGTAWVDVKSYSTVSVTNPVHEVVDLSLVCAGKTNAQVRFRWEGNGQGYWEIDNIHIYAPLSLDAGISAINHPSQPFAAGIQNVTMAITNYGYQSLTSATVKWSINGVLQPPFSWNGSIPRGNSLENVSIGSYNFLSGTNYLIKAWTENPNGSADPYHMNDTTSKSVQSGLCGTYTVGGLNPDFANLTEVFNYLTTAGVTCPVVFNIRNGSYNDQLVLNDIQGLSSINSLTFQSENNNSSLVNISSQSGNGVILNNVNHIIFRQISLNDGIKIMNNTSYVELEHCNIIRGIQIQEGTHHVDVKNNLITGQTYWGITLESAVHHVTIDRNTIRDFAFGGVSTAVDVSKITITNNYITNFMYRMYPGIGVGGDTIEVVNNRISLAGNGINSYGPGPQLIAGNKVDSIESGGIYISSANTKACNNYVTMRNNSVYGIAAGNPANSVIGFNNIEMLSMNPQSRAFELSGGSNLSVINNIFSHSTGGYAMFISGVLPGSVTLDHNDYYSTSNRIGNYLDSTYSTFPGWKAAIGQENNGINAKPFYISDGNLTPNNVLLDNAGIPIAGILYDIDSTLRNPVTPDIGAKEVNSCAPDAGIDRITAPFPPLVPGLQDVKVILTNQSFVPLTSVTIQWAINGSLQTPYSWNGTLASGQNVEVTVGTHNFLSTSTYVVTAWPSDPNGIADCNGYNNLAQSVKFYPKLCGNYTVGGVAPDFVSFTEVTEFLTNAGISCPVTFNIRDGIYQDWDRLQLGTISGSSATNTITFQSESGDSSMVSLPSASSLTLTKSSYITFKGIHFNGHVTINESAYINFSHCMITASHMCFAVGSDHVNVTNCYINLFCNQQQALELGGHHNYIADNVIVGGIYGGGSHQVLKNNSSWMITLSGDSIDIIDNNVLFNEFNGCGGGLYLHNAIDVSGNHFRILNNRITMISNDRTMTGIKGTLINSTIANNYITGHGYFSINGIEIDGENSMVCFNNIHLVNPYANSKALFVTRAVNLSIKNNIFSNPGGGYDVFCSGVNPASINMDYNDYYSLTNKIGSLNDTIYYTLASWATRIGGESHGVSANPYFKSEILLEPNQYLLNDSGIPVAGIDYDIDSVARNPITPDIGAKEFSVCAADAGINYFSAPTTLFSPGTQEIRVKLQNQGTVVLTSVQVYYELNGVIQPVHNWTGSLASGQSTEVTVGSFAFASHLYRLKAWAALPNGITDCNHYNDTCSTEKRYPLLCGTYTIGGASPDFLNFSEAAEVLANTIISCPIIFKVRAGSYPERIAINKVVGISALNRVTFESESGNNTDAVLTYPPSSSSLTSAIAITNISYLTFRNLTVESNFTNYFYPNDAFYLENSNHDTIENCRIKTYNTMGSYYTPGGIEARNCQKLFIKSNSFSNGGIAMSGSNYSKIDKNSFINVGIAGTSVGSCINISDCNRSEMTGNNIVNTYQGISASSYTFNDTVLIENNRIQGAAMGIMISSDVSYNIVASVRNNALSFITSTGISFTTAYPFSTPNKGDITNNFIHVYDNGVTTGISLNKVRNLSVVNNSINNMSANLLGKSFSVSSSDSLQVKNNIFSNTGNGFSCFLSQMPPASLFDFNNYYNTGNRIGSLNGTVYQTLPEWKVAVTGESNAKNFFPYFSSDTSFHIYQRNLNGAAIPVPAVTTDIEGEPRNPTAPDIGADEFKVDFGIDQVIAPTLICNHSPGEHIVVHVKQFGDVPFFNIPIAYKVNNLPTVTDTIHGMLLHDSTFTFNQTVDISSLGTYTIKCWMIGNWDDNVSNDTLLVTRYTYPTPVPDFTYHGNCEDQGTSFSGTATVTLPYSIASYGWSFGDGNSITGQNPVHVYQNPGTYTTVLHAFSNMGCYGEIVKPVTVKPVPVPVFNVTSANCQGMAASFDDSSYAPSGAISKWIWNFGDGSITTVISPGNPDVSHTYSSAGAFNVILTIVTADSCIASVTHPVIIGIAPITAFSFSSPVCFNTPVTFTDQSSNNMGGAINSWQWNFGDPASGGNNTSISQNPSHLFSGTGSFTVTLITGNGTCSNTLSHTVVVSPIPLPTLSGITQVCAGATGVIYTTESGMTGYSWNISSGGTITSGNGTAAISVNWTNLGSQTLSVNYTSPQGCRAPLPVVKNITVNALPVPTIIGPTNICAGSIGNIYTTQPAMTGYSWSVSAGGAISAGAGTNSITVTWNTPGAGTVSVNYINSSGCTAASPASYSVTVNSLPTPTLTGPLSVCAPDGEYHYITESGKNNYLWVVSPNGIITSGSGTNEIVVFWNSAGTGSVSVNYKNTAGCWASSPVILNITIHPNPSAPVITGPDVVCASTPVTFTTLAGMPYYIWTTNGNFIGGGSSTDNFATISFPVAGSGSVNVTYHNLNGCSSGWSNHPVTINPRPAPTLTGPTTLCNGTTGVTYTTEAGMTAYTWSISSGGTITSGGTTTSNTATVAWNSTGAQTISVNYSNSYGCSAASATIKNITINPVATPTLTGPAAVCESSGGNLYTTQSGMSNYSWSVSPGGTITAGGTATSNSAVVTWNNAGSQTISVNYTNPSGCAALTPTNYGVSVDPMPVPTIAGANVSCPGSTNNIYLTETGMSSYNWTVSSGGTITSGAGTNSINISWNSVGPQTVSVSYTNAIGCTSSSPSVYNVTISPMPAPTITGINNLCENTGYYSYVTEAGMTNYQWSVSSGGTISFGSGSNQVQVIWTTAGLQWVSVNYTNNSGCSAPAPALFNVTVNPLPGAAGNVTGNTTVCAGSQGGVYTVVPVQDAVVYLWTVPPGATVVSGAGTNSITVDFDINATSGDILVYGNNLCGNGQASTPLPVTVNPLPETPGVVSGPSYICRPATGIQYSVDPVANSTAYSWTLPPGSVPVAGTTSNSITVDFPIGSGSGDVWVVASNSCGSSAPSPTRQVTVAPVPSTPIITEQNDTLFSNIGNGNQWFRNDSLIPGAVMYYYKPELSGEYWDQVSEGNCFSDTSSHFIVVISGLNQLQDFGCQIYPVPCDGRFTISLHNSEKEQIRISIYNNLGQKILEIPAITVSGLYKKEIDLRSVPPGVYTIVLKTSSNQIVKKMLIKK